MKTDDLVYNSSNQLVSKTVTNSSGDTTDTYTYTYDSKGNCMLMEVSEEEYIRFYRLRNRQKYLQRAAAANQEISFDMLTTEERNGEELLGKVSP